MTQPLYLSRSRIEVRGPLERRAYLALGREAEFGVHGAIRELFKLPPANELPLPVDYIVAATGG